MIPDMIYIEYTPIKPIYFSFVIAFKNLFL